MDEKTDITPAEPRAPEAQPASDKNRAAGSPTPGDLRRAAEKRKKRRRKRLKRKVTRALPIIAVLVALSAIVLFLLAQRKASKYRTSELAAERIVKEKRTQSGTKKKTNDPPKQTVEASISSSSMSKKNSLGQSSRASGEDAVFAAEMAARAKSVSSEEEEFIELGSAALARMEAADRSPEELTPVPNLQRVAAQLLDTLSKSSSAEDWISHVRHPEQAGPRIKTYLNRRGELPKFLSYRAIRSTRIRSSGAEIYQGQTYFADYRPVVIYIERKDDRFLLDWESLVAHNDMSFAELITRRPSGSHVFRVHGSRLNEYGDPAFPEKDYLGMRLTEPHGKETLNAYAPRDEPALEHFLKIVKVDQGRYWNAIIEVRLPTGGAPGERTVVVERLVSEDWFIP